MELQGTIHIPEAGAMLDGYMLLILGIMVATGVLGGIANYFTTEKHAGSVARDILKYAVLGIVAALTVPLFLNMISSNLLEVARGRPIDLFVFAGFCLIFVVISRRFFENVANKLLQQVEQVKKELTAVKAAAQAAESAAAVVQPEAGEQHAAKEEASKGALTYSDIEIMRAVADGKFAYGGVSGLAEETSLTKEVVAARLAMLKGMSLIELKMNEKNVLHWYLAPKGKQLLGEVLSGQEEK
jgi:DNA-binding MarR family transcriptional regulator